MTALWGGTGAGEVLAIAAAGSPTKRTLPDRLAEIVNVKDFGAVGNGVADDTTPIQNAINAALLRGSNVAGSAYGATVFFPPGTYKLTSPLVAAGTGSIIALLGSGRYNTQLWGAFAGYTIQHDDVEGVPCQIVNVEKLYVKNTHAVAGSGAVKLAYAPNCVVRDCHLQGFNAIDMSQDSFNGLIDNCGITSLLPSGTAGTVGIYAGQTAVKNCAGSGWDVGISVGSSTVSGGVTISGGVQGFTCTGCRIESSNTGILVGRNSIGAVSPAGGLIAGFTTERCNTGIYVENSAGLTIQNVALTGTVDVAGTGVPLYGLRVGTADRLTAISVLVGVTASVANIDLSGSVGDSVTFIGCKGGPGAGATGGGGVNWNMPTGSKANHKFINCDNPANALAFADLPASPVEGMEFDINNSNTATWGATIAGGGANHVKGRYNGTVWTVMGK